MRVKSAVHAGAVHLLGCGGTHQGDHIAHLAPMLLSVLSELAKRWK